MFLPYASIRKVGEVLPHATKPKMVKPIWLRCGFIKALDFDFIENPPSGKPWQSRCSWPSAFCFALRLAHAFCLGASHTSPSHANTPCVLALNEKARGIFSFVIFPPCVFIRKVGKVLPHTAEPKIIRITWLRHGFHEGFGPRFFLEIFALGNHGSPDAVGPMRFVLNCV